MDAGTVVVGQRVRVAEVTVEPAGMEERSNWTKGRLLLAVPLVTRMVSWLPVLVVGLSSLTSESAVEVADNVSAWTKEESERMRASTMATNNTEAASSVARPTRLPCMLRARFTLAPPACYRPLVRTRIGI